MKRKMPRILLHLALILLSLCFIVPFIIVISISLTSEEALREFGYGIIPKVFSTEAYKQLFKNPHSLLQAYKVTIAFSVLGTLFSVFVMSLMAYPLSRKNFKYKKFFTFYIFFTMIFSGGLIPSYIIESQVYHLNNTFWIYIFPGAVSAYYVIMIRTFFNGIPESLIESAKIDGASELRCLFSIIMPLSKPVIASVALLTLLAKWNNWQTSLIYVRDPELYSLQYLLQRILNEVEFIKQMAESGADTSMMEVPTEGIRFAMAVLAAGPMLVVFPFFQKYFAKGLTIGAVKG